MKWIACLALALGCQQHNNGGDKAAPAAAAITPEYKQDIINLCDVVHLSAADQLPKGQRGPSIAIWLGPHIKTAAGHDFLVAIQPLVGDAKAKALDDEATRVGLTECALSSEWR